MSKESIAALKARIDELEKENQKFKEQQGEFVIFNKSLHNIKLPNPSPGGRDKYVLPGKSAYVPRHWIEYFKEMELPAYKNGDIIVKNSSGENIPLKEGKKVFEDEQLREFLKIKTAKVFVNKINDLAEGELMRMYYMAKDILANEDEGYPVIDGHVKRMKDRLKELNPELEYLE